MNTDLNYYDIFGEQFLYTGSQSIYLKPRFALSAKQKSVPKFYAISEPLTPEEGDTWQKMVLSLGFEKENCEWLTLSESADGALSIEEAESFFQLLKVPAFCSGLWPMRLTGGHKGFGPHPENPLFFLAPPVAELLQNPRLKAPLWEKMKAWRQSIL